VIAVLFGHVMPGLVPGIDAPGSKSPGARLCSSKKDVDGRDKPGHDEAIAVTWL
jgi:hypothetical protein